MLESGIGRNGPTLRSGRYHGGVDEKSLTMLEWPRVVDLLAERAATAPGRDRARDLAIETDLEAVSHALRLTTEARDLVQDVKGLPLGGIHDLRGPIRRLDQGADLDGAELLAIADTLAAARRLKSLLAEHDQEYPAVAMTGQGTGKISRNRADPRPFMAAGY